MKNLTLSGTVFAALILAPSVAAQQNDVDPNAPAYNSPRALGDLVAGAWDVEAINPTTGLPDNRCLGVEAVELSNGDLKYYVTGGGNTGPAVWDYQIHRFDDMGTHEASFPQVTNAAAWGGRDMHADGFTLYAGSDNAEVSEYAIDPATGDLTHTTIHTVAGLVGTARALCSSNGTDFYSKSFGSSHYEFTLAGGVTAANPVATPSAYGYGWDSGCGTIWSTDTGTNLTELMPDGNPTGRVALFAGPLGTTAQGGCDVYVDSRNTGSALSAVVLAQHTPDNIYVQELEDCAPTGPNLTVTGCGSAQGQVSLSGMTPNDTAIIIGNNNNSAFQIPVQYSICGGTTLDLNPLGNNAKILTVGTDGNGNFTQTLPISPNACGVFYAQGLDVATCTTTNLVAL